MHQAYEKTREANSEIQRVVENMFLVKILKTEDYEINRYKKTMEIQTENLLQNHKFGIINGYLPTFFTFLTLSFFLSLSTFATVITLDFIGVTLKLFQSLGFLTNCLNQIVNSHVHIAKFYELEKNKIISRKENFVVSNSSSIKFENVDFKYFNSESNIFENLNFELKEKSHTVITGTNGSGKSTLLGLLSGVFYPDRGKIYTFSDKFAYIGAVPLIFYDTLKNNLVYGNNREVEEKELINLLKHLNTFKEEEGYNLNREVSNKNLSSGQMQKIAFIRALISDPEILVLDEATANLDEESKISIFDILSERKITIVNSTHDPTSFKNVDTNLKIEVSDKSRKVLLV